MSSTIAKYIERFRFQEPLPAEQRSQHQQRDSKRAFWWLDEEEEKESHKTTLVDANPLKTNDDDDNESVSSEDSLDESKRLSIKNYEHEVNAEINEPQTDLKFSYSNLYLLRSNEIDGNFSVSLPPPSSIPSIHSSVASLEAVHSEKPILDRSFAKLDDKTHELFQLCDQLLEDYKQESHQKPSSLTVPDDDDDDDDDESPLSRDSFEKNSAGEEEVERVDLLSSLNSTQYSSLALEGIPNVQTILKDFRTSFQSDHPSSPERNEVAVQSDDVVSISPLIEAGKLRPAELTSSLYLSSDDEETNVTGNGQKRSVSNRSLPDHSLAILKKNDTCGKQLPVITKDMLEEHWSDEIVRQLFQQYTSKQREIELLRNRLQQIT